jgi:hypothetical protein
MSDIDQPAWTPPENPDPRQILREARDDTRAQHYEIALAKFVWFHDHALEWMPSLVGVRGSFALADWLELAKVYPSALTELKKRRDGSHARVLSGNEAVDAFRDFGSINGKLDDDQATAELFVWLDANRPDEAKAGFRAARDALIRSGYLALAAKHTDSDRDFDRILDSYRRQLASVARRASNDPVYKDIVHLSFGNRATTLVALLAKAGRRDEAEKVAALAKAAWKDPDFDEELGKALLGTMPPPRRRSGNG